MKVSRGLNYSGVTIPNIVTTNGNPGTVMGADGKYYFLNAKALNKWMRETFGTNPSTTGIPYNPNHYRIDGAVAGEKGTGFRTELINKNIADKKGIYSMVATESIQSTWASGHADFIDNSECKFGCYFYDANNNLMPVQYIDIWILE